MSKRVLLLLSALFFMISNHAQEDKCHLSIGTNLARPTDFACKWPFVNIMENAWTWETINVA
jgi:hypothetical protein